MQNELRVDPSDFEAAIKKTSPIDYNCKISVEKLDSIESIKQKTKSPKKMNTFVRKRKTLANELNFETFDDFFG